MTDTQTEVRDATQVPAPDGAQVRLGFELAGVTLALSTILPSRPVTEHMRRSAKYHAVLASVREVGIVEPPTVHPVKGGKAGDAGQYLLLDGHLRLEALRELGGTEVFCLLATDDESYTYTHKVNRLRPIHEHFMIMRALKRGVSEDRIARALHVDVEQIRAKRDMLRGICPEAVALARDTAISATTLRHLRAVSPVRQVEILELMLLVGNVTSPYCQALVAATPAGQCVATPKPGAKTAISAGDLARIEREVEALQRQLQAHEETYGRNFLKLVAVRGYLAKLLGNEAVVRSLSSRHPELLEGFRQIVESTSLEG
jgi:hypothetical protein